MDWKTWLRGLAATLIGGAANAVILIVADPITFNFGHGLQALRSAAIASAIVSAAMYLKQSPLPVTETTTEKTTVTEVVKQSPSPPEEETK